MCHYIVIDRNIDFVHVGSTGFEFLTLGEVLIGVQNSSENFLFYKLVLPIVRL